MATVERLPDELEDRSAGDTRISRVQIRVGEDSLGEPAMFVILTLSDPPNGLDTWPVDDIWALRRKVRDAIAKVAPDLELPWFVMFEPEHAEDLEAGDVSGQVDV